MRLDHYMLSEELLPNISTVYYLGRTHSDHNPHVLEVEWEHTRLPIPSWRLQPDALLDTPFRNLLATNITQYFEDNAGTATTPQIEWDAFKVVIRGNCLSTQAGMGRQLEAELTDIKKRLIKKEGDAVRGFAASLAQDREEHSRLLE